MTGFKKRTHVERLMQWTGEQVVPASELTYATFSSAFLPTRRFGPPGWVMFLMNVSVSSTMTSDLKAWVLYDARALRVIAYLERPLADTFGNVAPFELPGPSFDPAFSPVIGAAGEAFLTDSPPPPGMAELGTYFAGLPAGYSAGLRQAAPDFFQWLDRHDK